MNTQKPAFVKNEKVNYDIETFLACKISTSRGQETYGYNIVRLTDNNYRGKSFKTMGGGYDMWGTVLAHWLSDQIKNNELLLKVFTDEMLKRFKLGKSEVPYGFTLHKTKKMYRPDETTLVWSVVKQQLMAGNWYLDGACGDECITRIAKMLGITCKKKYLHSKRAGRYDTLLGVDVTLDAKSNYRKLCAKEGVRLYV